MSKYSSDRKVKIGQVGRMSEAKAAKQLNARLTPASGALAGAKGDMTADNYLIEAKSTVNKSMSLKLLWLQKITHESLTTGKVPAVSVRFTTEYGDAVHGGDWVMMPASQFKELMDVELPE